MELSGLRSKLLSRRGTVQTLEGGKLVERSYPQLAEDAGVALARLRRWGVTCGMRVGIYAQNCYDWLAYDLALVELNAIAMPFTRDFAGGLDEALFDKYGVCLVLTSRDMLGHIAGRPAYLAVMDEDGCNAHARPLNAAHLDHADTLS